MVHTNNNTTYYINPSFLTFQEDSGYGANLIQVSASSSCYIRVFIPGVIGYDSDGNYRKYKVTAYNNKFPDNSRFYIYIRLDRDGAAGLVVYSKYLYEVDGSCEETGAGASDTYYYIRIGEVSATDGKRIREISYDTGRLESDQVYNEGTQLNEMWELDKHSTPWLIRAKQWLSSFTVKGFVTLVGGLVFRNGDTEKVISDVKRSTDSDVPVGDDNLTTSKYVESYVEQELEKLDERFLSKLHDDETPYSLGVGKKLTVGEDAEIKGDAEIWGDVNAGGNADIKGAASVGGNLSIGGDTASKDFASGTVGGGYATRRSTDGKYENEADVFIARVLAKVYDLLVERDAVFKGSLSSEEFVSGFLSGKGWSIRMKEWINAAGVTERKSVAEFDDLIVRGAMRVYEFIVSQMLGENDNRIFTGMMEVDHYDELTERIYLKTDGGKLYNPFRKDDVIIVQQYGGNPSEENGYYITKQYELIVTAAGVGEPGEDRLDWVEFRDFSTSMEGGDRSLIAERDTLVRLDNISNPARKGIIQMMSVGEDTPYMDFVYGAKTDPENSLKARFGNLGGVYNPLFGWLREFGAYITNLYAVGEFRIAHTGEDVADAIEIAKGLFRTNHRQTTYDLTEEDDYFTNAAFTNNCEHWVLGEDTTEYFLVDDLPESFNYELYSSEDTFSGIAALKGRDMMRLHKSTLLQENGKIDKPSTHKVHTGTKENEDGSLTDVYEEVPDTLYLSLRLYVESTGTLEFGFADASGTYYDNAFRYSRELAAQEDAYEVNLSGVWDGKGDFLVKSSGDIYIDRLSLTDRPLDNFRITTETAIEQNAERISLIGKKVNGVEGSVTNLGLELNAAEERITAYVDKEIDGVQGSVSQLEVDVEGVATRVSSAEGGIKDAQAAADAAQQAADDAAADALAAQKTADAAGKKADSNATAISQNSQSISAIAAAFTKDASGNYILTSAAGAVITSEVAKLYAKQADVNALGERVSTAEASITTTANNLTAFTQKVKFDASGNVTNIDKSGLVLESGFASLFSAQVNAQGVAKTAEIKTYVDDQISGIRISADQIDITGDGLISIVNSGTTTINAARLNINGAFSANNTFKIDTSGYMTCIGGSIGGFTIQEDRLTVTSEFEQNIFQNPQYTTTVKGDGVTTVIGSNSVVSTFGVSLFEDLDQNYLTALSVVNMQSEGVARYDKVCAMRAKLTSNDYGLVIDGGSTHILSSKVTKIYGLALKHSPASGTASSNMDVILMTGNLSLPHPAEVPGKLYFIKGNTDYVLTVNRCVVTDKGYSATPESKTFSDNKTRIFISSGSVWYEFYASV